MRRPPVVLAAAAAILAVAALALAAPLGTGGGAERPLERSAFQRVLDDLVAGSRQAAPGAVAVVVGPDGTWRGAAGVADLSTGRRVTPDDHFRVASVTKTYTATVVLRLVAARELGLSDTVGRWLPGVLPADKRRITVRQLLAHSSGLYDSMNDAAHAFQADRRAFLATIHDPALRRRVVTLGERLTRDPETVLPAGIWVEIAAAEPLYFPPGSGYHYSNTNYVLLGWIVEKATGKPLGQVMEEQVFAPVGLDHTVYEPGPGLPEPFARSYSLPATGRGRPTEETRITGGIAGGSAVVATAEDVARFYAALLAGKLVPRLMLGVMLRERLGIFDYPAGCGRTYGHNGLFASYLSYARVSADGGSAAVLLLNGHGPRTEARGDESIAALAALSCGGASAAWSWPATHAA